MSEISMPTNKEEAEKILALFPNKAFSVNCKEKFLKAVHICYGPYYSIILDTTRRMCFYCTICNKEANSLKSLSDHSYSGTHLKKADLQQQCQSSAPSVSSSNYPPTSLQYLIDKSGSTLVGLQIVDSYEDRRGCLYYKCNLCGTHATADIMLRHLLGNKHCDRYINARVVVQNLGGMTNEDRVCLKTMIHNSENYSSQSIRQIRDSSLFPYMWKNIVQNSKISCKKSEFAGKNDVQTDDLIDKKPIVKVEPIIKLDTKPSEVQVITNGYLEQLCCKLNFVVKSHLHSSSSISTVEDLEFSFMILCAVLHYQFYTVKTMRNSHTTPVLEYQKNELEICLGYVMKNMLKHIREKIVDIQLKGKEPPM